MVDMRQAVHRAKAELAALYEQGEILDVRLEEVWSTEDDEFWMITLSFTESNPRAHTKTDFFKSITYTDPLTRIFKVVKIRKSDGTFAGMTIRAA